MLFATGEDGTTADVVPALSVMRRLTAPAEDHIRHDGVAADSALRLVERRNLVTGNEFDSLYAGP